MTLEIQTMFCRSLWPIMEQSGDRGIYETTDEVRIDPNLEVSEHTGFNEIQWIQEIQKFYMLLRIKEDVMFTLI